jgi:hypothetical protein
VTVESCQDAESHSLQPSMRLDQLKAEAGNFFLFGGMKMTLPSSFKRVLGAPPIRKPVNRWPSLWMAARCVLCLQTAQESMKE